MEKRKYKKREVSCKMGGLRKRVKTFSTRKVRNWKLVEKKVGRTPSTNDPGCIEIAIGQTGKMGKETPIYGANLYGGP